MEKPRDIQLKKKKLTENPEKWTRQVHVKKTPGKVQPVVILLFFVVVYSL